MRRPLRLSINPHGGALQLDGAACADALVGGQHDAQGAHRVVHPVGQVHILLDGLDAESYELPEEYQAIDVEAIRARI
jgi:hypothetical protein